MSSDSLRFDCQIQATTVVEGEHRHRTVVGEITAITPEEVWTFASSEIDHYRVGLNAQEQMEQLWAGLCDAILKTAKRLNVPAELKWPEVGDVTETQTRRLESVAVLAARDIDYAQLVEFEQDWAEFQVALARLGKERVQGKPDKPAKPGKPDHPHKPEHPGQGRGRQ